MMCDMWGVESAERGKSTVWSVGSGCGVSRVHCKKHGKCGIWSGEGQVFSDDLLCLQISRLP